FILGHYDSFLSKQIGEASTRLAKQYGGIVRYYGLFNRPYLLISDPKIVQQVLINRTYEYPKHFLNITTLQDLVGIHSIFFAHGNSHKRQRKMMHPSFSFANVKEMFPTFVQAVPNITLDVIGIVGFNYEFNSTKTTTELAQAYQTAIMRNPSQVYETIEGFFPFIKKLPTPNFKRHNDAIKVIQNTSAKLVDEKKHATVLGKDLLSLLAKANETCLLMNN
ncbi:14216_t:CDS:2, partial [Gigaspora margarita]